MRHRHARIFSFLAIVLAVSFFLIPAALSLWGGDDGDGTDIYDASNCYASASLGSDGKVTLGSGNTDCEGSVLADIFVYAAIYNSSRSNFDAAAFKSGILKGGCGGRSGWSVLDEKEISVAPNSDEKHYLILCGWKPGGSTGPRVSSAGRYEGAFKLSGPPCATGKQRGWYYSQVSRTAYSLCVGYKGTTYPSAFCDGDFVCTESDGAACSDCAACAAKATGYVAAPEGESLEANKENVKECQGDYNLPLDPSRGRCKWCPVPYYSANPEKEQPIVAARGSYDRNAFGAGISFPYLLPSGSYSTSAVEEARGGCLDIGVGDPFNCGLCGWGEEITDESQLKKGHELTEGFCLDSHGLNGAIDKQVPICAQEGQSGFWKCGRADANREASDNPWFATFKGSVNPSFFYTIETDDQGGWRSVVVNVTGNTIPGIGGGTMPGGTPPGGSGGSCSAACDQPGAPSCYVEDDSCESGYHADVSRSYCNGNQDCTCECKSDGGGVLPPAGGGAAASNTTNGTLFSPNETGYTYGGSFDDYEYACQQQAGPDAMFDDELGCCGGGKYREGKQNECEITSLCDGERWHNTNDPDQLGEVFYLPEDANMPFPVYNKGVGKPFTICSDKEEELTISRLGCGEAEGGGVGCVGKYSSFSEELCCDANEFCGFSKDKLAGQMMRGGAGIDYQCPFEFYFEVANAVPGVGMTCRMPGTHKRETQDTLDLPYDPHPPSGAQVSGDFLDHTSGVLFCNPGGYVSEEMEPTSQMWGHAYLIESETAGASKAFPFDEGESEVAAAATSARCPSAIAMPWLYPGGKFTDVTIMPCPGLIPITVESTDFYAGPFGSTADRIAGTCFKRREGAETRAPLYGAFTLLDYVSGSKPWFEYYPVAGYGYVCYHDLEAQPYPAPDGESNAFVGICCGNDGCANLPAKQNGLLDGRGAKEFQTGEFVVRIYGGGWNGKWRKEWADSWKRVYCNSTGGWSIDLDMDYDTCVAAGKIWTGTQCCSEGGDEGDAVSSALTKTEYYYDPGGKGVCFDAEFKPNGGFITNNNPASKSVFVSGGEYFGCLGDGWRPGTGEYPGYNFEVSSYALDFVKGKNFEVATHIDNLWGHYYDGKPNEAFPLGNMGLGTAYSTKSGRIIVAWLEGNDARVDAPTHSEQTVVYASLLSKNGSMIKDHFKVGNFEALPSTTFDGRGGLKVAYDEETDTFLVVWTTNPGLKAAYVKPDGTVKPEFRVTSESCDFDANRLSSGRMDFSKKAGKYVLVCSKEAKVIRDGMDDIPSYRVGEGSPVSAFLIDRDAHVQGPFSVGTGVLSSAAAGPDNFVISWLSTSSFKAKVFDYNGVAVSQELLVGSTTNTTDFSGGVAFNPTANTYQLFFTSPALKMRTVSVNATMGPVKNGPNLNKPVVLGLTYSPVRDAFYVLLWSRSTIGVLSLMQVRSDGTLMGLYDISQLSKTSWHLLDDTDETPSNSSSNSSANETGTDLNSDEGYAAGDSLRLRYEFSSITDVEGIPFSVFFRMYEGGVPVSKKPDYLAPGTNVPVVYGPFSQFGGAVPVEAKVWTSVSMAPRNKELPLGELINYFPVCTQVDMPGKGNAFCDLDADWKNPTRFKGSTTDRSHYSSVPPELYEYMKSKITNGSFVMTAACCSPGQCWDPLQDKCIFEQKGFSEYYQLPDSNVTYKCQNGEWGILGGERYTPDGCTSGFCPQDGQCLFDPKGSPFQNGNVSFGSRPQCINSGQFYGDHHCLNGSWSSRTRLAAITLSRMLKSDRDEFVLSCGEPEDLFIRSQNFGQINSVCILDLKPGKSDNKRIFATSLNQEFELPPGNESDLGKDYWYALK
ncbi:hypothetical protein JW826_01710, partial [Candidatus Woesearchaeota archaeon]|nr:hypothetical protein [Candidatus Woesearchaeota archaeon]